MSRESRSIFRSLQLGRAAAAQALIAGSFLVLAIVLGGATAEGAMLHAILQCIAIALLFGILIRSGLSKRTRPERQLLVLTTLLIALFVIQLIPLPPALWGLLSGRRVLVEGFNALMTPLPWLPLSLAPAETLRSGVALLPALAMMVMTVYFDRAVARIVALMLVVVATVSVLIGMAQVAGSASLYFYRGTNIGSAVGFFANPNHFGTLMCVAIPLAAGLAVRWLGGRAVRRQAARMVAGGALGVLAILMVLGIGVSGSMAAILLGILALVGGATIIFSGLPRKLRFFVLAAVVLVVVLTLTLTPFFLSGTPGTLTPEENGMGRAAMWQLTAEAIGRFGAAGSGFGSFQQVFHLFEDPGRVGDTFANHAHNDLLEFILEGGIPGVLLVLLFLSWFGKRLIAVWSAEQDRDPLARGASLAALIILLHSLVDYPLRTAGIAVVMGFCCAVMARPPRATDASEAAEASAVKHMAA